MRSIGLPELAVILAVLMMMAIPAIAVVIFVIWRANRKKCSACRKRIDPQATLCPYCRTAQQV